MNGFKVTLDTMNVEAEEIRQVVSVLSTQLKSLEKNVGKAGQYSSRAKRALTSAKNELEKERNACSKYADVLQSVAQEYASAESKVVVQGIMGVRPEAFLDIAQPLVQAKVDGLDESVGVKDKLLDIWQGLYGGTVLTQKKVFEDVSKVATGLRDTIPFLSTQAERFVDLADEHIWETAENIVKSGVVWSPLMPSWSAALVGGLVTAQQAGEMEIPTTSEKLKSFYEDVSGMTYGGGLSGKDKLFSFGVKDKNHSSGGGRRGGTWEYNPETKEFDKVVKEKDEKDDDKDKNKAAKVLTDITLYESQTALLDDALYEYTTSGGSTFSVGKGQVYIGHKLTTGAFEASMGAEFTALAFESAKGQIGNDMLGAHGSVKAKLLSASANASASAGWLDENGNFDPHLSAKASAEVVVAKVEGEVGLDILGSDVNLKGSVGFGAGAHAEIGIKDGKLTINAGAYLGIGGDISLEIDVSGLTEGIVNVAGDTVSAIGDAAKATGEFIGDVAKTTGEFVGNVAESTGEFVRNVGEAAGDFISGVGKGIKKLFSW